MLFGGAMALAGCAQQSSQPLTHEAYVWQRVWTPAVVEAVTSPPKNLVGLRILVAQSDAEMDWHEFDVESSALQATARRLTAVVRINGRRPLSETNFLVSKITSWLKHSNISQWSAIEIDYDCPTRALAQYASFLRTIRVLIPDDMSLSVTVLPAWMDSGDLPAILSAADRSVLQVHSVMDPHRGLIEADTASHWIDRYAAIATRPFYVALPNYGSRVTWTSAGRLQNVVSEDPSFSSLDDSQELTADPVSVARLLHTLRNAHPKLLLGVVWFRLPVSGGRRIWSGETWQNVMEGLPLQPDVRASVERDAQGAYQIRLLNSGTSDARLPATVRTSVACVAADGEDNYVMVPGHNQTTWRRSSDRWIRVGEEVRIGWTRCDPRGEITLD
jgi:hypothetical protein